MKLYEAPSPNARRVHIALAEKGIEVERIAVDIRGGENISADFLAKNPGGRVPTLELDDGTFISESVAITRYLDAIGEGPSLFGDTPLSQSGSSRDVAQAGRAELSARSGWRFSQHHRFF